MIWSDMFLSFLGAAPSCCRKASNSERINMKSQINLQNPNANSIYDDNQAQVRIVAKRQYILDDDVVIAADNIKKIGELIALLTIRTVMCRSGKDLYRLYDGLSKIATNQMILSTNTQTDMT